MKFSWTAASTVYCGGLAWGPAMGAMSSALAAGILGYPTAAAAGIGALGGLIAYPPIVATLAGITPMLVVPGEYIGRFAANLAGYGILQSIPLKSTVYLGLVAGVIPYASAAALGCFAGVCMLPQYLADHKASSIAKNEQQALEAQNPRMTPPQGQLSTIVTDAKHNKAVQEVVITIEPSEELKQQNLSESSRGLRSLSFFSQSAGILFQSNNLQEVSGASPQNHSASKALRPSYGSFGAVSSARENKSQLSNSNEANPPSASNLSL